MRYHVISLVAVFLALGIGILLGTTLVERGLIAEQKSEIRSLKKTFEEIKEKNKSLHDDLKIYQNFAAEAEPYLLTGRLNGMTFGLITQEKPSENVIGRISDAVAAAGGIVTYTVILSNPDIYENDPSVVERLSNLFQAPQEVATLKELVFAQIANQMQTAQNGAMMSEMENIGVLKTSGQLEVIVNAVVTVPGEKGISGPAEESDIPLVRALGVAGVTVVMAAGAQTEDYVVSAYKKAGISTVDHAETVPGQVALVMVLQGRPGNYGSSKEATRLIPEPAGI